MRAVMASNNPQTSQQSDFLLELTSPQGCVDSTTRNRSAITQGELVVINIACPQMYGTTCTSLL